MTGRSDSTRSSDKTGYLMYKTIWRVKNTFDSFSTVKFGLKYITICNLTDSIAIYHIVPLVLRYKLDHQIFSDTHP